MNKNCPICGKQKDITTQDLLLAMMVEFGARTSHKFEYCHCSPNAKPPKYITGNWLTESRAERKGGLWPDVWRSHNLPEMRDCRDMGYKYAVIGDRIICNACSDYYDITEEVLARG